MAHVARLLKIAIRPYKIDGVVNNLFLFFPRAFAGLFLTFKYTALNIGLPWSPKELGLSLFQIDPKFVHIVENFGGPFKVMPLTFTTAAIITMGIGGIFFILGLNTRVTAVFITITMFITILCRDYNSSWDILPTFIFFCVGLFCIGFGSGKFGLDQYISEKYF